MADQAHMRIGLNIVGPPETHFSRTIFLPQPTLRMGSQMKHNRHLLFTLIVLGFPSIAFPQALQCTDIARTLKEFSISTSSSSYLNSVFDSYCEASGNTKTSSGSLGLDAVVKAIPIKFTGSVSNSDEAMKNFCKNYAGTTAIQERKFSYEEKIASKALDTVAVCLRVQT